METNVLLIVLDSARADHTSVYGYKRPTTPNLEQLATDAHVFENAFAAAPWTPPSHGSLFSGVYPSKHRYLDAGMSYTPPHDPLAAKLSASRYLTIGATQNSKIGSDSAVTEGFEEYGDIFRLPFDLDSMAEVKSYYLDILPAYARLARASVGADRRPVELLTTEYLQQSIRDAAGERPFFGFINVQAPHSRYAPPEPYRSRFRSVDEADVDSDVVDELTDKGGYRFMADELDPTEAEWDAVKDRYDGEMAFADAMVGRLVEMLRNEGMYDETLIIVTADHGEHFGEHGRAYHQFSLFDELLEVPLVIKRPNERTGGTRHEELVSLVDVFPTVLSELDLSVPPSADGTSVFDEESRREEVFAEYGDPNSLVETLERIANRPVDKSVVEELNHPLQCVRTKDRKYVRTVGGVDGFYEVRDETPKDVSLDADPNERLRSLLAENLGRDLSVETQETTDPVVEENLKNLGYL